MKCAKALSLFVLVVLLAENSVHAQQQNNTTTQKPRPTRRPGFFRSLYSLIFDTKNDVQKAYNQISTILSQSFQPPRTTTLKPPLSLDLVSTNEIPESRAEPPPTTMQTPSTTKKLQISLTREEFNRLVRRNLLGLAKLFDSEWQNAVKESRVTIARTGREFRKSLEPFVNN